MQTSECILFSDRNEKVKYISEGRKLVQKEYKSRHDWAWKVIRWELRKRLKLDQTDK